MSYLEPGPIPRRHKLFACGFLVFALLFCLEAFKLVDLHGFVLPIMILYLFLFVVYDARVRKKEDGSGD